MYVNGAWQRTEFLFIIIIIIIMIIISNSIIIFIIRLYKTWNISLLTVPGIKSMLN